MKAKGLLFDVEDLDSLDHLGIPPPIAVDVKANDSTDEDEVETDPDLSTESETDESGEEQGAAAAAASSSIQGIAGVAKSRVEAMKDVALTGSGRARADLTASQQRRKHVYAGEVQDLRAKLDILITRYADVPEVVGPLLSVLDQLNDGLNACGVDPNSVPAASSFESQSLRLSAIAGVSSRARLDQMGVGATEQKEAPSSESEAVAETEDGGDSGYETGSDSDSEAEEKPKETPADQGLKPAPRCSSLHPLSVSTFDGPNYTTGWICDTCRQNHSVGSKRWWCQTCEFDLCFSCEPEREIASESASSGFSSSSSSASVVAASSAAANTTEITCPICFDDFQHPTNETYEYSCKHVYCKECLQGWISEEINTGGVLSLHCTDPNCDYEVTPDDVEKIVTADTFGRYQQFKLLTSLRARSDVCWCPNSDCDNYVEGVDASSVTVVTCNNCETRICTACEAEEHPEVDCEAAKKQREKASSKKSWRARRHDRRAERWVKRHTQLCAKCGAAIRKNGGCKHMTCSICKYEFCWKCHEEWHSVGGYGHSCRLRGKDLAKDVAKKTGIALVAAPLVVVGGAAVLAIGGVVVAGALVLSPIALFMD